MRIIGTIMLMILLVQSISGQKTKILKRSSFDLKQVNHQWIYVKKRPGTNSTLLKGRTTRVLKEVKNSHLTGLTKVKVPNGKDPIEYCNELLKKSEDLLYAEPIVEYIPLFNPNDILLSNQFYLTNIKAFQAWDVTKGDDDITVGIIDSGLDLDHEDMSDKIWVNNEDPVDGIDNDENGYIDDYYGYDFADLDSDPNIEKGNHGMIVGGIAGATVNNNTGIAGVGYNTKIAALKGFRSSDGISNGLYEAIIYAADNGIDVVNLSWGRMGIPLQSEQDIINYAVLEKNMIVVAAAGNEGNNPDTRESEWYPASYENVLSVGASDQDDNKSSGSTFNHSVDLIAPGVNMFSTVSNNGYANGGPGTSYAAPQVAAAAALVKDQFPTLSAIQIMERVRATADDIYDVGINATYDGKLGKGRLNVLRAVSENNVKSLRAEPQMLTSNQGSSIFFGDTVKVTALLTNYLSAVSDPIITISSPQNNFSISQGIITPGYMGTLDAQEIEFEVILNEDVAPETKVGIRLDYSESNYADFQFLDVTTSPDYVDFGNDKMYFTIAGDGNLGFADYNPSEGSGLIYQLDTLLKYSGIMIATNASSVSDNIISNYSSLARSTDFTVQQFYKLYDHPGADHFGYSEFQDANHPLIIEQSNISWENEDFIILRYRIINESGSPINNLSFGMFNDWDLNDPTTNYAEYDLSGNYIYARNNTSSSFAGVKILGGDTFEFSAIDMGLENGNPQDINNVFDDNAKYDYLVNQDKIFAGSVGIGNDVATMNGVTITLLEAYSDVYVDVILAVSDSKSTLEAEFVQAEARLDDFLQKPRILETFFTCDGVSVNIDPSSGTNFEFYEDPLSENLITTGTSFNPGMITRDTTFYVRNIDQNYRSDVFEVKLNLLNDIAAFSLSTDTLYLDDPSINVVSFSDESLDAVSWDWDFDEGTQSTLQNPQLSFDIPGIYNISLTVTTIQECTDTIVKQLVVANRPAPPSFSDIVICPGENVTIMEPGTEKLLLYRFEDQSNSIQSGSMLTVDSVLQDTVIYISEVYGSLESEKTPVNIDVLEVSGSMMIIPDTISEAHQMIAIAQNIEAGSTLSWIVDGQPAGDSDKITFPSTAGEHTVSLTITGANACSITLRNTVEISTSPFAAQVDISSCGEEAVTIAPNGIYFGFYEDAALSNLIKKGSILTTDTHTKIYIVNLDDGLPGMPIEVNITQVDVDLDISFTTSTIEKKQQVSLFAITDSDIESFEWFINDELTETVRNPTFFFDDQRYEISLRATSSTGCIASDTVIFDFTTPLSSLEENGPIIYPNPTTNILYLKNDTYTKNEIEFISMSGTISKKTIIDNQIDVSDLPSGIYLISLTNANRKVYSKVVVTKSMH